MFSDCVATDAEIASWYVPKAIYAIYYLLFSVVDKVSQGYAYE